MQSPHGQEEFPRVGALLLIIQTLLLTVGELLLIIETLFLIIRTLFLIIRTLLLTIETLLLIIRTVLLTIRALFLKRRRLFLRGVLCRRSAVGKRRVGKLHLRPIPPSLRCGGKGHLRQRRIYLASPHSFREKPNSEIQPNGASQRMPYSIPKADLIKISNGPLSVCLLASRLFSQPKIFS
jgi:hypothetical protein